MHPDTGIGRPRPARHKGHTGSPGHRPIRRRHIGNAAFLTADDLLDFRAVMQRIEHREEAFPRHGENAVAALLDQLIDEDAAAGAFLFHL